jgi:phosphoenolpyruvate carboxylase
VFHWGQARFALSSWYGSSTALKWLYDEEPTTFETMKVHP